MFDQLSRSASIIYSGEHAWVGSRVDYPINCGKALEVCGVPNIGVLDGDSS
jgi:hypothetical protein